MKINGSRAEFIALTLNSRGCNINADSVQNVLDGITEEIGIADLKDMLIEELNVSDNDEIKDALSEVLNGIENLEGDDDLTFNLDLLKSTNDMDLSDVIGYDDLYNDMIDTYRQSISKAKTETTSNDTSSSSSDASTTSQSTSSPFKDGPLTMDMIAYKDQKHGANTYYAESPDFLKWCGETNGVTNLYTKQETDGTVTQYKKTGPDRIYEMVKNFSGKFNIKDGAITTNDGDVIGYVYQNKDGSISYYLKAEITYNNLLTYLDPAAAATESSEEGSKSSEEGSKADDTAGDGDDDKVDVIKTREITVDKSDCEAKGYNFEGGIIRKDGKEVGTYTEDRKDGLVKVCITDVDAASDIEEAELQNGNESYSVEEDSEIGTKTSTIKVGDLECVVTSEPTSEGSYKVTSIKIGKSEYYGEDDQGGQEALADGIKDMIQDIEDVDVMDALVNSGILEYIQTMKYMEGDVETDFFKEILGDRGLNKNGGYEQYANSDNYFKGLKGSEKSHCETFWEKYGNPTGNNYTLQSSSSDALKDILDLVQKNRISPDTALYLMNEQFNDMDEVVENFREMSEGLLRGGKSIQEEYLSTLTNLIYAANFKADSTDSKNDSTNNSQTTPSDDSVSGSTDDSLAASLTENTIRADIKGDSPSGSTDDSLAASLDENTISANIKGDSPSGSTDDSLDEKTILQSINGSCDNFGTLLNVLCTGDKVYSKSLSDRAFGGKYSIDFTSLEEQLTDEEAGKALLQLSKATIDETGKDGPTKDEVLKIISWLGYGNYEDLAEIINGISNEDDKKTCYEFVCKMLGSNKSS